MDWNILVDRIGFNIGHREPGLKMSFIITDRVVASFVFGFFVS